MEQNFKSSIAKCLACGILITIIVAGENLPLYCQNCRREDKDSQQHLPEESFAYDYFARGALVSVSGSASSVTTTGSGYAEVKYIKSDWNPNQNSKQDL